MERRHIARKGYTDIRKKEIGMEVDKHKPTKYVSGSHFYQ